MASFPIKTDPMSSLSGYFQMRQPRAADMQPSPPGSSGFSSPSATESAFHVLASNPPDVTKSSTFSTPAQPRPIAYAPQPPQASTFAPAPVSSQTIQDQAAGREQRAAKQVSPSRFSQGMSKGSTQPAYASAGDNVPKGGTGGTGFTSFNQYFGANAPAAQRAAQTEAQRTGRAIEAAQMKNMPNQAFGFSQAQDAFQHGLDAFRAGQGTMLEGQQASSAGAFDAMLAARANPQAAVAEQQRLNQLSKFFADQQAAQEAVKASDREFQAKSDAGAAAYKAWYADLPQAYKTNYTPEELLAIYEQEGGAPVSGMVSTSNQDIG